MTEALETAIYVVQPQRGLLKVSGPDRVAFLQGLVSNDVEKVSDERTLWSAFLTPQGKFLHEFFMSAFQQEIFLECEAERMDDLKRRLILYKLRSQVEVAAAGDDFLVAALFGPGCFDLLNCQGTVGETRDFAGGRVYVDPRLPELGARAILPRATAEEALRDAGFAPGDSEVYDQLRMQLGVPEGSRDLEVEKSILLENGFDELHGLDWDKGCYMGQELTARTKYRALIKKRLMPVQISGPALAPGTRLLQDGKEAGVMRSVSGAQGLAVVRLEALGPDGSAEFHDDSSRVVARKPAWADF